MAARFWIGTSGWHYAHWKGVFYPEGVPTSALAGPLRTALPHRRDQQQLLPPAQSQRLAALAPLSTDGFGFAVKANRFLTHVKRLADMEEQMGHFLDGARLLEDRLGPVLYQLPPTSIARRKTAAGWPPPWGSYRRGCSTCFVPPRLLALRRLPRPAAAVRGRLLRLRHAGPGVSAGGDSASPTYASSSEALHASNYTDEMLADWAARLRGLAKA